eukprot:4293050-Amphidinium_carterae.1
MDNIVCTKDDYGPLGCVGDGLGDSSCKQTKAETQPRNPSATSQPGKDQWNSAKKHLIPNGRIAASMKLALLACLSEDVQSCANKNDCEFLQHICW